MNRPMVASRWNLDLLEDYQRRWKNDPSSVDESWRNFFEGFELGSSGGAPPGGADFEAARAQAAVTRLIDAYREVGHYLADLDPLKLKPPRDASEWLEPSAFGLTEADLDKTFATQLFESGQATLRELISTLREIYCRSVGVEYMHIRNMRVRQWLKERMEPNHNRPDYDQKKKRRILLKLTSAELFENFLQTRFIGKKRFSLEGGESLIPLLDAIIERSSKHGVGEILMGMPHRGRLNVLTHTFNKPYSLIFSEFKEFMTEAVTDGDVKYHLGFSGKHVTAEGYEVHLSLTPNPSHLEAVNPVVEGRMRSKQRRFKDGNRAHGLPVLMHGDAAFAGQGLVSETLNLSQLPGYDTCGTIHIVVNNQIGFTTNPEDGRSTRYCTDVAKMLEVPIFHVNGDDPEAVVYVAELAMDYRQTFGQDVVIDMVCYRKNGHNETDEPAYTQPLMYDVIRSRKSVPTKYAESLIASGEITADDVKVITETINNKLESSLKEVLEDGPKPPQRRSFTSQWSGLQANWSFDAVETAVPASTLREVAACSTRFPEGFTPNPKLQKMFAGRLAAVEAGGPIDWGTGEALAFGTLLLEKIPVRLSGQDSRRGTFSHRHASLADMKTGRHYVPLNHIRPEQAGFCAYDSLLSEAAVLGFDYGFSIDEPHMLIMWEAQFGDFVNGAQVIIDQFITSAESKWGRSSGLVMLLPHGYEGQGPEHSSARLERFLQACAEDNIQVVNATTPAQFFHLLRRQVKRDFRRPLVVMSPKSMLRHKQAVSKIEEFTSGTFQEVLDDTVDPSRVRRVLLCSGKVYYDLLAQREAAGKQSEVAIVRLEQFYPWPADRLTAALGRYRAAKDWVWVQEESQNMGGWSFVAPRLHETLGKSFQYVGRDASASPAAGSLKVHQAEQDELVQAAIGADLPHLVASTPVRSVAAAKG